MASIFSPHSIHPGLKNTKKSFSFTSATILYCDLHWSLGQSIYYVGLYRAGRSRIYLHVKCQLGQLITMCFNRRQGGQSIVNAPAGHLFLLSRSLMHININIVIHKVTCTYLCKRRVWCRSLLLLYDLCVAWPNRLNSNKYMKNLIMSDCFLENVAHMLT